MMLKILLWNNDTKIQLNSCLLCSSWPGKTPPNSWLKAFLSLQLRLMFALPELDSELECPPAPCGRTIFIWGVDMAEEFPPLPQQRLLKELCGGCIQIHGLVVPEVRLAGQLFCICRDPLKDNTLNVQRCFCVLCLQKSWSCSVCSWHFDNLKRETQTHNLGS